MIIKRPMLIPGLFLLLMSLQSCNQPTSTHPIAKTVSISDIYFSISNTPSDWWDDNASSKPSLSYDFTIRYSGKITSSEMEYARIYLPDDSEYYWTLDPANDLDTENNSISISGCTGIDTTKELPLGIMKGEIKLTSGTVSSYSFTMGRPGATTTGGYSIAYSSEDEGSAANPAISVPALMRPTIDNLTNNEGTITVNFKINGPNIHNGVLWFYDGARNYIGKSPTFLDRVNGEVCAQLNNGIFNYGDGQSNTISLHPSSAIDTNGNTLSTSLFDSIQHCRVVVMDGFQYAGDPNYSYATYDYRAISAVY